MSYFPTCQIETISGEDENADRLKLPKGTINEIKIDNPSKAIIPGIYVAINYHF